jgi:hypothetical protein
MASNSKQQLRPQFNRLRLLKSVPRTPRLTLRENTKNSKMSSKRDEKVRAFAHSVIIFLIAWEMLVKKMEKLDLSEAE